MFVNVWTQAWTAETACSLAILLECLRSSWTRTKRFPWTELVIYTLWPTKLHHYFQSYSLLQEGLFLLLYYTFLDSSCFPLSLLYFFTLRSTSLQNDLSTTHGLRHWAALRPRLFPTGSCIFSCPCSRVSSFPDHHHHWLRRIGVWELFLNVSTDPTVKKFIPRLANTLIDGYVIVVQMHAAENRLQNVSALFAHIKRWNNQELHNVFTRGCTKLDKHSLQLPDNLSALLWIVGARNEADIARLFETVLGYLMRISRSSPSAVYKRTSSR